MKNSLWFENPTPTKYALVVVSIFSAIVILINISLNVNKFIHWVFVIIAGACIIILYNTEKQESKQIEIKQPNPETIEDKPILTEYHETLYSMNMEDIHREVDKIIGEK